MKQLLIFLSVMLFFLSDAATMAQEILPGNAQKWKLTGRVQLQHLYNSDIDATASQTNQGFRIRRGRLQVKATVNKHVKGKLQIAVRDNNPRLKDAVVKLLFPKGLYAKFGQFKVPVWREELRSSGKLLLIERSEAAEFLAENHFSSRSIGVEFGGHPSDVFSFAINYSNGAGAGAREDAGRKKTVLINNGKMWSARIEVKPTHIIHGGISAVVNSLGKKVNSPPPDSPNNSGNIFLVAPDVGIYLPSGITIESGLALGKFTKEFLLTPNDIAFTLFDITGRWQHPLSSPVEELAGLSQVEFAAGFTFIEPDRDTANDEQTVLRFGPAVYFGKNTRLQVNGEIENPAAPGENSIFKLRSQITLNF